MEPSGGRLQEIKEKITLLNVWQTHTFTHTGKNLPANRKNCYTSTGNI